MEFDLTYDFSVPGETHRISLTVVLPETIPDKQKIVSIHYSVKPSRIFRKNGNRYAEFTFEKPQKRINIEVSIKAELFRYDLKTAKSKRGKNNIDNSELSAFIRHEKNIEKNHAKIQDIAGAIGGQKEEEIVKNIYDYVIDNMEYIKQGRREWGAVKALQKGKGDCTEFSDLFVTLCRAKGIPARTVSGYTLRPYSISQKHNWAEVYLNDYGWVPFDPSIKNGQNIALRNRAFSTMSPVYIYFSNIRNDKALQNYHFASYTYWGDKVTLKDSIDLKRSSYFIPKVSR